MKIIDTLRERKKIFGSICILTGVLMIIFLYQSSPNSDISSNRIWNNDRIYELCKKKESGRKRTFYCIALSDNENEDCIQKRDCVFLFIQVNKEHIKPDGRISYFWVKESERNPEFKDSYVQMTQPSRGFLMYDCWYFYLPARMKSCKSQCSSDCISRPSNEAPIVAINNLFDEGVRSDMNIVFHGCKYTFRLKYEVRSFVAKKIKEKREEVDENVCSKPTDSEKTSSPEESSVEVTTTEAKTTTDGIDGIIISKPEDNNKMMIFSMLAALLGLLLFLLLLLLFSRRGKSKERKKIPEDESKLRKVKKPEKIPKKKEKRPKKTPNMIKFHEGEDKRRGSDRNDHPGQQMSEFNFKRRHMHNF